MGVLELDDADDDDDDAVVVVVLSAVGADVDSSLARFSKIYGKNR